MCGFAGFVGKVEDRETVLVNMMDTIIHREPGKCKRIWQVVRELKIWYDYGQDIRRIRS